MKTLFKLIMLALVLAIVYPAGWLAWRMNQPMDAPEFKGLTYHQYTAWMREEYDKAWVDVDMEAHLAKHPKSKLNAERCYEIAIRTTHIAPLVVGLPLNMVLETVLLDEPFPEHPLQTLWQRFDDMQVGFLASNVNSYFCRIPGAIPDDYALSVGAKLPDLANAP